MKAGERGGAPVSPSGILGYEPRDQGDESLRATMPNSVFYPLAALIAICLIALASVYPQGIGARSPRPFGHETAAHYEARTKKTAPPKSKTKTPSTQITLNGPQ